MVKKLSDRDLVAREYATVDRLAMRRLDRTAWLGGEDDPWLLALAAIAEVRPTRVLDAGCGSGDFASLLTAPDVRCVDLSPAAVDAAHAKGLNAEVADIQNLPFPDGSFDVAVANWVLYHVRDRALAIAELIGATLSRTLVMRIWHPAENRAGRQYDGNPAGVRDAKVRPGSGWR